jgi:hypothetical protein
MPERMHEFVSRDHLGHAGPGVPYACRRVDGQLDRQANLGAEQLARSVCLGARLAVHRGAEDAGIGLDGDDRARAVQSEHDLDALPPEQRVEITHRLFARGGPVRADIAELHVHCRHDRTPGPVEGVSPPSRVQAADDQ